MDFRTGNLCTWCLIPLRRCDRFRTLFHKSPQSHYSGATSCLVAGQAASVTVQKTPCSYSPPASDSLLPFLGAIATGITSATVCMDKALLLSAGATYDRVHGTGYVGFASHDGGRDYTDIN